MSNDELGRYINDLVRMETDPPPALEPPEAGTLAFLQDFVRRHRQEYFTRDDLLRMMERAHAAGQRQANRTLLEAAKAAHEDLVTNRRTGNSHLIDRAEGRLRAAIQAAEEG